MRTNRLVSILIPCYNEVENVIPIARAVTEQMEALPDYDYEIVFIDNHSTDGTREKLKEICDGDGKIKAILNAANFGQFNSPFYGLTKVEGDCAITLCADFQDPVDTIPRLLEEWEKGTNVVCAIKEESEENKFLRFLRTCYYKLLGSLSDVRQIEHFTGFGLYDKSFLEVLRRIDDPAPFLRGIVAEYAPNHAEIPYRQAKRREGKTHNGFWSLYDGAMLSLTTYTKKGIRLATILGAAFLAVTIISAFAYLLYCLFAESAFLKIDRMLLFAVVFFGSLILFFVGVLGEYVITISRRTLSRPLVVEEGRLGKWK